MSIKFENLSENLITLIGEMLGNEELKKLLYYNSDNPLSEPNVPTSTVAPMAKEEKFLPYPFDMTITDDIFSQVHVYFPDLKLKNKQRIEEGIVWFDIVVNKKLWLFTQDGNKLVRPYQIASQITKSYEGDFVGMGSIEFRALAHVSVNKDFDALRIEAKVTDVNGY